MNDLNSLVRVANILSYLSSNERNGQYVNFEQIIMNHRKKHMVFFLTLLILGCLGCGNTAAETNTTPLQIVLEGDFKGTFETKFYRYAKSEKPSLKKEISTIWKDTVWQNDRVHKQIVLWTTSGGFSDLEYEISDLKGTASNIPASAVQLRFLSYITGDKESSSCGSSKHDAVKIADALSEEKVTFFTSSDPLKLWLTVNIPEDAIADTYKGNFIVKLKGETLEIFIIELKVVNHKLPAVSDWSFHLDLWQFPFQLANLCNGAGNKVLPFSPAYFTLIEPFYRLLANTGQKAITTYVKDGAFRAGESMVKWKCSEKGKWSFDYTDFDNFVEHMMKWGITKQINCFSLVGWDKNINYYDADNNRKTLELEISSPQYKEIWNTFLTSFKKHLVEKGWFEKTVLYMDEIKQEEMKVVTSLIKEHDKQWKIGLAGSNNPAEIEGLFYDYSTFLGYNRATNNPISTFYTSCSHEYPNNYVTLQNSPAEMSWMAWYASASKLGGYLRWAYDYWLMDDPTNIQDQGNAAGDFNMIYRTDNTATSRPVSSIRLELLREGIQDYEKIRLLNNVGMNSVVQKFTQDSGREAEKLVSEAQSLLKKISVIN